MKGGDIKVNNDRKALVRGKYEIKKEKLRDLKDTLQSQAAEISELLRRASDSPTAAYVDAKRELIEDALDPVASPQGTHLDQLSTKIQSFIENVKKYQEINKETVSLSRQAR